jgi:TolA-binding protein
MGIDNSNYDVDSENYSSGDPIYDFERKLNSSKNTTQNKSEGKAKKALPSLEEQLKQLEHNQSVTDERIDSISENVNNLKGDLLEIKNMLSDIDAARFKPYTEKVVTNNSTPNANIVNGYINKSNSNLNDNSDDNIIGNTFIISSEEEGNRQYVKSAEIISAPSKQNTGAKPTASENTAKKSSTPKSKSIVNKPKESAKIAEKNTNQSATKSAEEATGKNDAKTSSNFSDIINLVAKADYTNAVKNINNILSNTNNQIDIANCNYWLGECSFNQRDYAKAINHYKSVLNSTSDKKDIAQARIADSYIRVGKNEEAKLAYKTLLEEYPKSSYSPKAKKMLQQL